MSSLLHDLGWVLFVLGCILECIGSLWIVVVGWQRNILWGVVCFLVPIVQLIYVALHWKESKEAFYLQIAGLVLVILAALSGVPGS